MTSRTALERAFTVGPFCFGFFIVPCDSGPMGGPRKRRHFRGVIFKNIFSYSSTMEAANHLVEEMLAAVKHSDAEAFALSVYAPAPVPGHVPLLPLVRLEELIGLLEQTVDDRRPDIVHHNSRPIHTPVSLPIETQQLILASLTWPTLMRCRLVCRYWADACVAWVARIPDGLRLTRILDSYHFAPYSNASHGQCALLARFDKLTELHIEVTHANVTSVLPRLKGCFRHLRHVSLDFLAPMCALNCRDREKEKAVIDFLQDIYQTSGGQCTSLALGDLNESCLMACDKCKTFCTYDPDVIPGETPITARIPRVFGENITRLELHDWSVMRLSGAGLDRLDHFSALTELHLLGLGLTDDIDPVTLFPYLSPRSMARLRVVIVDSCRADLTAFITFVALHGESLETLILSHLDGHLQDLMPVAHMRQTINTEGGSIRGCSKLVTLIFDGAKSGAHTVYVDMIMKLAHLAHATLETLIVHGDVSHLPGTPKWDFHTMHRLRHLSIEFLHSTDMRILRAPVGDEGEFDVLLVCQTGPEMLATLSPHGLERVELSLYFMHMVKVVSFPRPIWTLLENAISKLVCSLPAVRHLVVEVLVTTRDDWLHCFDKMCAKMWRLISKHLPWHPDMLLKRLTLSVLYERQNKEFVKCVPLIFDNPY